MLATMSVAARIDPRQAGLVGEVRRRVGEIDAELPLADLRPMSERLRDSVARPRLYAVLLILFAGLALILAVSGVYSVISYSVSQRTRETGVRMAFGATSSDIVRLVSRDGLRILLWGLALGLLASFGLSRLPSKRAVRDRAFRSFDLPHRGDGARWGRAGSESHPRAPGVENRRDESATL